MVESEKMTNITDADRERVIKACEGADPVVKGFHSDGKCCVDCEPFASELAAARREGEIAEAKYWMKMVKVWICYDDEKEGYDRIKQLEEGR